MLNFPHFIQVIKTSFNNSTNTSICPIGNHYILQHCLFVNRHIGEKSSGFTNTYYIYFDLFKIEKIGDVKDIILLYPLLYIIVHDCDGTYFNGLFRRIYIYFKKRSDLDLKVTLKKFKMK